MVRHHGDDVDGQRANAPAVQQIVQAMAKTRDHDHDLHLFGLVVKVIRHVKRAGRGRKPFGQFAQIDGIIAFKADPHKEVAGFLVVELGTVGDVAGVVGKVIRNRGDDPAGRRTGNGQGKGFHGRGPVSQRGSASGTDKAVFDHARGTVNMPTGKCTAKDTSRRGCIAPMVSDHAQWSKSATKQAV